MDDGPLPPHIASPLAPFAGEKPPAPDWFEKALAQEPERTFVEVRGADIEVLAWGPRGAPGLIFIHGASAHADWWSFIAPQLADRYRIIAVSLSGMGKSGWREAYSFDDFSEEMDAAASAAGLLESEQKPIYIGHSFGGAAVYYTTLMHPDRMRATILVDSGFGGRSRKAQADDVSPPPPEKRNRIYPTFEAALARFRFMPPQPAENLYIVDWIARRSLKPVEGGFTWRFDPMLFPKLDPARWEKVAGREPGPIVHIHGDRSKIMERNNAGRHVLGDKVPFIVIPDSEHHVMVDQPLALVAALRSVLTLWP